MLKKYCIQLRWPLSADQKTGESPALSLISRNSGKRDKQARSPVIAALFWLLGERKRKRERQVLRNNIRPKGKEKRRQGKAEKREEKRKREENRSKKRKEVKKKKEKKEKRKKITNKDKRGQGKQTTTTVPVHTSETALVLVSYEREIFGIFLNLVQKKVKCTRSKNRFT